MKIPPPTSFKKCAQDSGRYRRSEPRARKRRPKDYQLLNRPRTKMRVSASRRLR